MISWFNWFFGTLFLMAAFGASMNPPPYVAIALLLFLIALVFQPSTDKLIKLDLNQQIKGGAKGAIVLSSLLIICLIVPQVSTDTARLFSNPVEQMKHQAGFN